MTDQEVQLFLADLAIIILLARLLGMAAKRLGQPPVLGEIIAGILLGPTLFHGKITATLFPAALKLPLSALANLGVVMFMFTVGYQLDMRLFRGRERVAASVSVSSVILPLSLGTWAGCMAGQPSSRPRRPAVRALRGHGHVGHRVPGAGAHPHRPRHAPHADRQHRARQRRDRRRAGLVAAGRRGRDRRRRAGGQEFRLLLAPVYAGVMFGLVRPLLRRLVDVYQRRGRLTPNVLAVVLVGLLLSSYATDWMGVKYIFGAFLFGVVMPREGAAAAALREEILGRLEQVSVLVLLPVFFVVSGLSVNLSSVSLSGLVELCLILLVAIVGKFGGAFAGARIAGVRGRRAGVLATLMNTRGLTGIVILAVGLQLHILDPSLYSLMIVMAIVTTAMAGPLLNLIYPERFVRGDIAEADRAALGTAAGHRILVLIETPETAAPLIDVGAALAASRVHSQLILCHLVPHEPDTRLEVGTGLGGELLETTSAEGNASGAGRAGVGSRRGNGRAVPVQPGHRRRAARLCGGRRARHHRAGAGRNSPRDACRRRNGPARHGPARPAGGARRRRGPVDAGGGRRGRRAGRRAARRRGPAEAGDQSGRWPARGSGGRAHEGRHRRERRPAARRGDCRGRCRRQRATLTWRSWRAPGRTAATWTSGSGIWTRAGSLSSADMDGAAARGPARRRPVAAPRSSQGVAARSGSRLFPGELRCRW